MKKLLNKYGISIDIIERIFDDLENGEIDGLDAMAISKTCENISKSIRLNENVINSAVEEIEKYDKKEIWSRNGCSFKFQKRRTYVFDFPYYNKVNEEVKMINQMKKQIEKQSIALMQSNNLQAEIVDENGEVHEILPPTDFKETYSIAVTMKK